MDNNIPTLVGVLLFQVTTILGIWLETRRQRRKRDKEIQGVEQSSTGRLNGLKEELFNKIAELRSRIMKLEGDRDEWQLRALQCEERERSGVPSGAQDKLD